nr:hypothetical protein CFP56_54963 [Quercus suber]
MSCRHGRDQSGGGASFHTVLQLSPADPVVLAGQLRCRKTCWIDLRPGCRLGGLDKDHYPRSCGLVISPSRRVVRARRVGMSPSSCMDRRWTRSRRIACRLRQGSGSLDPPSSKSSAALYWWTWWCRSAHSFMIPWPTGAISVSHALWLYLIPRQLANRSSVRHQSPDY